MLGRVEVIATTHAEKSDLKANVERCRIGDWDKFKCVGLALRTDDKSKRSMVQRKETVEYITTMVKFSLVKRISGLFMLDKENIPGLPEAVAR